MVAYMVFDFYGYRPWYRSIYHLQCQYLTFGASFLTSDVQFVNYINIWSGGIDSR